MIQRYVWAWGEAVGNENLSTVLKGGKSVYGLGPVLSSPLGVQLHS